MKKKIGMIIFLLMTAVGFAEIEVDGVSYYDAGEVAKTGIKAEGGILQWGENLVSIDEGVVHYGDYSVEFPEAVIKRGNTLYYNSFLIEEIAGYHEMEKPRGGIVSLSPGITEKVFALGIGEELKGRTVYCKYPQEAEGVAEVGSMLEPSLEKVIVKNPEVVLMEAHYNEGFVKQLKMVGMRYRIYDTPKSLEEMYEHLRDLGEELGVEVRAGMLTASLRSIARIYQVRAEAKAESPSIYYALGTGRAEYTAGGDTFIGDILNHSGGINIAGDKKGWNYSLEELIAKDPQYIVGDSAGIRTLRSERKYSLLRAVREDKLIEVDTDIFNLPGVRAVKVGIPLIYNEIY